MEESDGTLWIATLGAGLFRWRAGRLTQFPLAELGLNTTLYDAVDDGRGGLWTSSNHGITRFEKSELNAWADGSARGLTPTRFGIGSGMLSIECNGGNSGAILASDGTLWFSTLKGLVRVDPSRLNLDAVDPVTLIETVVADGNLVPRDGAELPPGTSRIAFAFTSTSMANPERVRFRYKLEGFDAEWQNAGARRAVEYTNLAPRQYRFRVMSSLDGTSWKGPEATFDFRRRPRFTETPQFHAAWALCLLVVLALVHRARMRIAAERERILVRRVDEQTEVLRKAKDDLEAASEALRTLSLTDALTGAANRRAFDDFMDREWSRAQRGDRALALILIDVDMFKVYNDRYGHQGGDACLQAVASALGSCIRRGGDLLARYGGEEFAVVLAETNHADIALVAESLRAAVAALNLPHEGSTVAGHVTISLGTAAAFPQPYDRLEELIAAADAALYRAKDEGRNRVAVDRSLIRLTAVA
jgi:diguanylate cyclase (GGDEF)-like protein